MPASQFQITPTPPTTLQLAPGQEGKFSFTVQSLAAPERVNQVILQALLVGDDGKGKEVDWLAAGPQRAMALPGGGTATVTITARPTDRSPRGDSHIKLLVADRDRPNDLFADSPLVICEVVAPATETRPPVKRRWWWIPAIAGGVVLLGGGALLAVKLATRGPGSGSGSGTGSGHGIGASCDSTPAGACDQGLVCDPGTKKCVDSTGAPGEPQLLAIEPSIAGANQMITLEGTFPEHVTVRFPGGVSQDATVLGPHRATVSVPAQATEGRLSIATGGTTSATTGSLAFRRASFAMGLGAFGLADALHLGTQLVTSRHFHTSVIIGNYVYVLGGQDSTTLASTERATINADGSLRTFATVAGAALVTPRAGHTAVVIGSYLYILGGSSGGALSSVERAAIHDDGTLGAFAVVPDVALDTARYGHTSAVIGNYLYVIGGTNGTSLGSVERAVIHPDASLGAFAPVAGLGLRTARERHTSAVIGSYLYVLGGIHGGALNSVERASIAGDGSLGPFAVVPGVALAMPRDGHVSAVIGSSLYVLGGESGFVPRNDVERATIHSDGSLGQFASDPAVSLAHVPVGDSGVVIGNYLYLLGEQVERATLVGDGSLGGFAAAPGVNLTTGRSRFRVFVAGSYLYAVGGTGGPTTVERAAINPDGSLGRFAGVPGATLSTPRVAAASAVIGNRLYVLGGDGAGRAPLTSIDAATIDPDGSLGAFAPAGSLAGPVPEFTAVVLGNNVYAVSGLPGASFAQRATIAGDGSLGAFSAISGIALLNPRSGYTSALIGPYVYFVAGITLDPTTSVERAPTDFAGSLGTFTASSRLVTSRWGHSSAVIGNYLYVLGGYHNGGSAESSIERAALAADGSLGPFAIVPGINLVTPRYRHANAVIGNYLYVLGGEGPGVAPLTTIERAVIGPDGALGVLSPVSRVGDPPPP